MLYDAPLFIYILSSCRLLGGFRFFILNGSVQNSLVGISLDTFLITSLGDIPSETTGLSSSYTLFFKAYCQIALHKGHKLCQFIL